MRGQPKVVNHSGASEALNDSSRSNPLSTATFSRQFTAAADPPVPIICETTSLLRLV